MAKKSKSKKKKKKINQYYKTKTETQKVEEKEDVRRKTFFDTIFMIGIGFLIIFYATYLVVPFSKYSVTIVGLLMIGYGSYKSLLISQGKSKNLKGMMVYSRSGVIFDISKLVLVGIMILYSLYMLAKIYLGIF